jgi:hypothetical protein
MLSRRSGRGVANQYFITGRGYVGFQSYNSNIARCVYDGNTTISADWNYSITTMRYLKDFINKNTPFRYENAAQFSKLINDVRETGVLVDGKINLVDEIIWS